MPSQHPRRCTIAYTPAPRHVPTSPTSPGSCQSSARRKLCRLRTNAVLPAPSGCTQYHRPVAIQRRAARSLHTTSARPTTTRPTRRRADARRRHQHVCAACPANPLPSRSITLHPSRRDSVLAVLGVCAYASCRVRRPRASAVAVLASAFCGALRPALRTSLLVASSCLAHRVAYAGLDVTWAIGRSALFSRLRSRHKTPGATAAVRTRPRRVRRVLRLRVRAPSAATQAHRRPTRSSCLAAQEKLLDGTCS
jgi:hypothetical protein